MLIGTWNLERPRSTSRKNAGLQQAIAELAADILVLTETNDAIAPEAMRLAAYSTSSDRVTTPGERWVSIWTTCSHGEAVPTADPARTACARVHISRGPSIIVFATVLPWRGDTRFLPLKGQDAFVHVLAAQAADCERLRATYPADDFILAGDFNQETQGPFYVGTSVGCLRLAEACDRLEVRCVTGTPDDPLWRLTGARNNIDHICLSRGLVSMLDKPSFCWPTTLGSMSDHHGSAVVLRDS